MSRRLSPYRQVRKKSTLVSPRSRSRERRDQRWAPLYPYAKLRGTVPAYRPPQTSRLARAKTPAPGPRLAEDLGRLLPAAPPSSSPSFDANHNARPDIPHPHDLPPSPPCNRNAKLRQKLDAEAKENHDTPPATENNNTRAPRRAIISDHDPISTKETPHPTSISLSLTSSSLCSTPLCTVENGYRDGGCRPCAQ